MKEKFVIIEDDDKCSGCQRHEVHKYCPAYGTAFYMSGVEYTRELECYLIFQMSKMGCEDGKLKNPPRKFNNNRLYITYCAGYFAAYNPHLVEQLISPD